jgi:AcrR family transcriptional regulator
MAEKIEDRRSARTRRAIVSAFVALIVERRYDSIRVADVAEKADVGRSTFYEHFRSKEDLLRRSMEGLLSMIADAAGPQPDDEKLGWAVAHFWENRRLGRTVLAPPLGASVRRQLETLIEQKLEDEPRHARVRAIQIAAAQFALLEAWTRGDVAASQEQIVERLRAAARL